MGGMEGRMLLRDTCYVATLELDAGIGDLGAPDLGAPLHSSIHPSTPSSSRRIDAPFCLFFSRSTLSKVMRVDKCQQSRCLAVRAFGFASRV